MKKRIALLASIILAAQLSGCTSKDSQNESELGDDVVAESSEEVTDGELDQIDAPADDGAVASSDGANEGFLDDQLPEDALGESTNTAAAEPSLDAGAPPAEVAENATPPPGEPSMDPMAADALPPSNDLALDEALGSVDTGSTPPAEEPPPAPLADTNAPALMDTPPPVSDTTTSTLTDVPAEPAAAPIAEAKPKASLKKVEASPFKRKGVLLNAVYVARPGDDYKKISSMIYGDESKSKELAKVNPSLGKKPKPGDKVYYNSPARSADDSKLLTFYEDSGMMPELYVAKEGDNLKKVAKELLGYDNAWKELWVTNSVDSKGELTAGTELRYWKTAPAAAAPPVSELASGNAAPPADPSAAPMPDLPPPPPAEMAPPVAMNDVPPPAEMAPPPADLPPPPPAELPPPAEVASADALNPPPPPMPKKANDMAAADGMDQDMMMSLAGAGIIAAGLAMIIIIRKRRQDRDRMNNAFSDTQVGT